MHQILGDLMWRLSDHFARRTRSRRTNRPFNGFVVDLHFIEGTRDAEARGLRLLKDNLSPGQRAQYANYRYFEVTGGTSGKCYRIRHGQRMNVELLDRKGKPAFVLCFMPKGHLADGDIMLAQKIALELFENDALTVAKKIPTPLCRLHSIT